MADFQVWSWGYEGPAADVPDECVHRVFERRAARAPDAVAVEFAGTGVGYGELNARANRLARYLLRWDLGPGDVVGVHLHRGVDMVVAVLAVLKAAGAYVMLDPAYPPHRLRAAAEDARVRLVVTDSTIAERVRWPHAGLVLVDCDAGRIAELSTSDIPASADPGLPACVMFTSGTTGRAKGVVVSHRALLAWLVGQDFLDFSPERVWLQFSPISWDIFALELFGAVLFGGRCVLQPGQRPDPAAIAMLVVDRGVDTLSFSAGLLELMLDEYPSMFPAVRQIMVGGEPPSVPHLVAAHRDYPRLRLVNAYGAVETALLETYHVIGPGDAGRSRLPIGRPATNTRGYVLDERLEPVASGEAGELYVASAGMADGYAGQPGLTAERFVANPFAARPGSRLYRTGDLVRIEPDGTLMVLGRTDDQVKARGFRVVPAEIEAALCGHPGVRRAAVLARPTATGGTRIVACVVASNEPVPDDELLNQLRERLPEHLVPDALVALDALPLTPTGKVDRAALPDPRQPASRPSRAARSAPETLLCGLFASVLNVPEIGIDDNFFRLGGDSLLAARLVNRIRVALGVELNQTALFRAPTVAELAPLLATRGSARPALRPMRETRSGR